MLPLSAYLWCVAFCITVVATIGVKICPLDDDAEFDNCCTLETDYHSCEMRCQIQVEGEEKNCVGEMSTCFDGQTQMMCFKGKWVIAGKSLLRRKRWLWGGGGRSAPVQHNPTIHCPGNINVKAPGGKRSAAASWPRPSASDPNGDIPSVTQTEGPASGSVFPEGPTPIKYTARDNTGRTATCIFIVTVTVTYCSNSQKQAFGSPGTQTCQGAEASNIYGSTCQHSCPTGYTLQGQASVYCQSNGQWNGAFPRCQIVSCGKPADVAAGQVSCPSGYTYNRQCVLQCQHGFISSHIAIICGSSGQWTSTLQPCLDKTAPKFPNGCPADLSLFSGPLRTPVEVTWPGPVVTDNGPDPVNLTSDPAKGSRLGVGRHTVRVTAVDGARNTANCSFLVNIVAKECPPLLPPTNGHVSCTSGHVEGSKCTFDCSTGYRVQGHSSLTCLGSEQWNRTAPKCEAIMCPARPEVEKGSFLCPQGHQFPAECTLTCESGYNITGSKTIKCQENETWTQHGSCRDIEPPRFVSCPSDVHSYASRLGNETRVSWTPLQASDNSGSSIHVTCDATSGSAFLPGTTAVTCTASDAAGNSRNCKFSVNVTVLLCPNPGTFLNNQSEMLFTCSDGHVHGAKCMLGCSQDNSLLGEDQIVCERRANTNPPQMRWTGTKGELTSQPKCKVDKCPRLEPPKHGSLSCMRGLLAQDCFIACHSGYDVSARSLRFDGYFFCNGRTGVWTGLPSNGVPQCVVRKTPWRVQIYSHLFYLTDACNGSESTIRDNFITRLTSSDILKDACAVPTCVARNVKVTCGPVTEARRRRTVDQRFDPRRPQKTGGKESGVASHQIVVSFEVTLSDLLAYTSLSDFQLFRAVHQTRASLTQTLTVLAASGRLMNPRHVQPADVIGVSRRPSLRVHCPPGTLLRPLDLSPDRFSCVGCSKGHYLPPDTAQCWPCSRGQFSPLDSATSCMPCPLGMTTVSSGATDPSLCLPSPPTP